MIQPFHLSFSVPDLAEARSFYLDLLGCRLGRDKGDWIDILFFGHQLTIHQQNRYKPAQVLDHFGPILSRSQWQTIIDELTAAGVPFEMPPKLTAAGQSNESGKFLVRDPGGNLLEFKFYADFDSTVKSADKARL